MILILIYVFKKFIIYKNLQNTDMSKNCFIYETLNAVKQLESQKNGNFMTLSGVFGVCGVKNNNQRVYETHNYSKMVSEMQKRIKEEGGIPGELEHPQTMNITLENVSHKIDDIQIDENGVVTGTITLLNTPKGQIAQAIVEAGLPLFISSRAKGNVAKDGKVTLEELKTYDLVGSPGFSQAKLKLNENQIAESICESMYYITEKEEEEVVVEEPTEEPKQEEIKENNNIDEMELKEIMEKFAALEERIEELEQQNADLQESLNERNEQLADAVQQWVVEEYSPELQRWMTEHFGEDLKESINEGMELSELKQEILEQVSEGVQKWVIEQYSPEVQEWIIEHVCPEIQNWIVEEYSQGIEGWIAEELKPDFEALVAESIKESKKTSLDSIDETIKLLENFQHEKPVHARVTRQLNEDVQEPKYIAEMPDHIRPMWAMASQDVKEAVARKAKLCDLLTEGAIEKFWNNINFDTIVPAKKNNIQEGLEEIENTWERNMRAKIRASRIRKF